MCPERVIRATLCALLLAASVAPTWTPAPAETIVFRSGAGALSPGSQDTTIHLLMGPSGSAFLSARRALFTGTMDASWPDTGRAVCTAGIPQADPALLLLQSLPSLRLLLVLIGMERV